MTDLNYRFDFALSFAGPQRTLARQLRDLLVAHGFRVFFDQDYEHEMLGLDGMKYLRDIYSRQSRVCIVLISAEYSRRAWTELEREAIQSRELRGEQGALIPVMVESYRPGWLPESRVYFDLTERTVHQLADILCARVRGNESFPVSRESIGGSDYHPSTVKGETHLLIFYDQEYYNSNAMYKSVVTRMLDRLWDSGYMRADAEAGAMGHKSMLRFNRIGPEIVNEVQDLIRPILLEHRVNVRMVHEGDPPNAANAESFLFIQLGEDLEDQCKNVPSPRNFRDRLGRALMSIHSWRKR